MALAAGIVWEMRTAGSNNSSGGFVWDSLRSATYKWTASGSGTDEYHLEAAAGGDPGITQPTSLHLDGHRNVAVIGSIGSLAVKEWVWGNNDALGYNTVYVRLADGTDPDTKDLGFVGMGRSGGTDYSQQAAAQASFTNLSTDVAGTQLTDDDAGGNFTALMVGNLVYISAGTGFVVGWYEIVTFIDSNNVTIDRSAGSSATAGTGAIGGARALQTDTQYENNQPGNFTYTKSDGTYTLTSAIAAIKDGTVAAHIFDRGYNVTRGDTPTGTDRPLIAAGANSFQFDDYWDISNLRITSSNASAAIWADVGHRLINIKAEQSSTGNGVFGGSIAGLIMNCEGIAALGSGIRENGSGSLVQGCYAHDSSIGIRVASSAFVEFSIIDTCSTSGIQATSTYNHISSCTIYNCLKAVDSAQIVVRVINSIIDSCTDGLYSSNAINLGTKFSDYNNFNNNTTDYTNWGVGANDTYADPGFTDALNGDFSIGAGVKGSAFPGEFPGGLSTGSLDQGAVQSSGNGGISSYGHFG